MAVVSFAYADWLALFPQFATTVNSSQANACFDQATLYCANSDCALVPYSPGADPAITTRLDILYLITAHVAQLLYGSVMGGTAVPAGPLVGRITDATQGSVTVKTEMKGPAAAAWFMQTQFGAMAWAAMAQFRTARYRASPGRYALVNAPLWSPYGRFNRPY